MLGFPCDDVGTAAGCGEFLSRRWNGGQGCGGPRVSFTGDDSEFGHSDDAPAIGVGCRLDRG